MIPVTGSPAIDPGGPDEDVPAPEVRNQFKVPGGYEFGVEFL
jgi:hypothetical protein